MRTFIIQQGVAHTGKTSVIREAYKRIKERFPNAVESDAFHGKSDFRVVLTINHVRIGIESYGDPPKKDAIERRLALYVKMDCRLILCAARSFGVTVEAVRKFIRAGDREEWRQRYRIEDPAEREQVNRSEARWVAQQVEAIVAARRR